MCLVSQTAVLSDDHIAIGMYNEIEDAGSYQGAGNTEGTAEPRLHDAHAHREWFVCRQRDLRSRFTRSSAGDGGAALRVQLGDPGTRRMPGYRQDDAALSRILRPSSAA